MLAITFGCYQCSVWILLLRSKHQNARIQMQMDVKLGRIIQFLLISYDSNFICTHFVFCSESEYEPMMTKFKDYQKKASMYYVYHTIQRYMVREFKRPESVYIKNELKWSFLYELYDCYHDVWFFSFFLSFNTVMIYDFKKYSPLHFPWTGWTLHFIHARSFV